MGMIVPVGLLGLNGLLLPITAVIGVGVLLALVLLSRDAAQRRSGSSAIFFLGLLLLFVGERILGLSSGRLPVSAAALLVITLSLGLRTLAFTRSQGQRKAAHQAALVSQGVALLGLGLYALTLPSVMTSLGLAEQSADRWYAALTGLWPVIVLSASLPMILLDRMLAAHPRALPLGLVSRTVQAGLAAAFAIALLVPVNYLASVHKAELDVAYFRTTRAGTSTLALARTLSAPTELTFFFPPGNDVGREVLPYAESLAAVSDGKLTIKVVDQALDPALAEKLKVRENGWVIAQQGESIERHKLGDDLDKAKRELKKLDETVQKMLLKVSRGQTNIYLITGHGEATAREQADPLRKLAAYKKLLESQNAKVKNLGVPEGFAVQVPEDADVLILNGPEKPLLAEEIQSLKAYLDKGGSLLVTLDVEGEPQPELLDLLGLTAGRAPLAHTQSIVPETRTVADRILLATNRFGSHPSMKTLQRGATQLGLIMPTVSWLEKADGSPYKVTALVRTFPDTWEDLNNNRQPDANEGKKVWDLAVAVTPEKEDAGFKAIVIGDTTVFSDLALTRSQGNAIFAVDSLRWLIGEEALAGTIENEEDVKIRHTRDEDVAWFYLTIFGMPLLVLCIGVVFVRLRGRSS